MRLIARPHGPFASAYTLARDDATIATLRMLRPASGVVDLMGGRALHLRRDDPFGHAFTVEADGAVLLGAARPDPLRRRYEVAVSSATTQPTYILRARSGVSRAYLLLDPCDGERAIGAIHPQGAFGRGAVADLPDAMPIETAVALVSFVVFLWRLGLARATSL